MDKASRALAQPVPPSLSDSYRARADRSGVPHTTLHHRARGRRSIEEKAQSQQYLAPYEEDALVRFLLQLSDLGQPVRIKYIRFLAFCVTGQRSETDRPLKPPGKNWTRGFEKRHPETQARRVKALDWSRHEKNTYWKITHWYLDPMVIWPAATHRSNWTTFPTPGWQYACSDTGYTDSYISLQWLQRIFDPATKERARGKPRVLICDGFGTHETLEVLEFCFANNILLCRLPSHTSHKLQPCDVAVFSPLKAAYREQVERLERGGVNTIGKEHFTSLYSPAREKAFTSKNIIAGFAASGLFPFNPDRVLRSMPKPLADLTIPKADEVNVEACRESEVPQTPVTPVSAEGLASLRNLIIEQDAGALDETSKRNLQRHLHKLAKAAQLSLAEGALHKNHIRFLLTVNSEAKVRRSTTSLVLGKAKVMGYEELVEAREKRAEKDAAQKAKGKGKRDRKRKSAAVEHDTAEPKTKATRVAEEPEPAVTLATTSTVAAVVGIETAPPTWRAPVARMY
ncbi:hypothetical protein CUC08_Gglean013427 [Alternaria sp. MG1]|nr:hypothetical protein CUC08_Gglean013427 [Alternaria sp. MG1]